MRCGNIKSVTFAPNADIQVVKVLLKSLYFATKRLALQQFKEFRVVVGEYFNGQFWVNIVDDKQIARGENESAIRFALYFLEQEYLEIHEKIDEIDLDGDNYCFLFDFNRS